jgi:hypothetical protein
MWDGLHPWHLRSKVIVNISPSFAVTILALLSSGHRNASIPKVYTGSFGKREMTVFGRHVHSPLQVSATAWAILSGMLAVDDNGLPLMSPVLCINSCL